MSSLDRLLKAFESVRGSNQGTDKKSDKTGVQQVNPTASLSFEDPGRPPLDSQKTMSSLASTLSQQSQNLLSSKRDQPLTSREKLSLCQSVSESLITGGKSGTDAQKLIGIGMETLLVLIDDQDPDVRMSADEALNRVIRSLSETYMGKIQLELFKEIKKNGSSRSLRGALTRFAVLCHHIRPQKCRAYVQNLLPYLTKIAKRTEESLHETLAHSLEKILPVLGYFTNDNEIRGLLKAFLPNVNHSSASMRRSATSCLMLLCQHSRKPRFFLLWMLDAILQMLLPIQKEKSNSLILGSLLVLRSLAPHFPKLSAPETKLAAQSFFDKGGGSKDVDILLSYDQVLQVYEICLYYCSVKDHNIITGSLETLQALLQHPSSHLLIALTSPDGITRSRIGGEKSKKLSSRAASQVSIAVSLQEEESSIESLMEMYSKVEICSDEGTPQGDSESFNFKEEPLQDGMKQDSDLNPNTPDSIDEDEIDKATLVGSVYSDIEMGTVEDSSLLLGRKEIEIGSSSSLGRKRKQLSQENTSGKESNKSSFSSDEPKVCGNIGAFTDDDLPVRYLVRFLCSSFLFTGYPGSLMADQISKVSIKVLSLNCVGLAITLQPSLMTETLFIVDENTDVKEEPQRIEDVLLFHEHPDPQVQSSIGFLIGNFIRSSLVINEGCHDNYGRSKLDLDTLLDLLCKLLYHGSSVTVRGAIQGLHLCLNELFHSFHATSALSPLCHLGTTTKNTYWLVKVELCELYSNLPLRFIDYLESQDGFAGNVHVQRSSHLFSNSKVFTHRILSSVFIPLLGDQDHRVRKAAAMAVTNLIPDLVVEGNTTLSSAYTFVPSCRFTGDNFAMRHSIGSSNMVIPLKGITALPAPFRHLFDGSMEFSSLGQEQFCAIENSLAKVIHIFYLQLLTSNEKCLRLGCLETLSMLSEIYPPILYPKSWGCHIVSSHSSGEKGKHTGLVTLLLALNSEATLSGDLNAQQFILKICANWLAGRAVLCMKQKKSPDSPEEKKKAWSFLGHPKLGYAVDCLLQHILRILSVYLHVLEGTIPSTRNSIVPSGTAAALSPIKRKSKIESGSEKGRSNSPGKGEKLEDEREKPLKSGYRRSFVHLPEYIKLYDVLKSAFQNYKMSLEDDLKEKFSGLLRETLNSLGIILELSSMTEFGRLSEELLQYLIVSTPILPSHSIFCGQQLLKCLFGSNVVSLWDQIFPPSTSKDVGADIHLKTEKRSLYDIAFAYQSAQLQEELRSHAGGKLEFESSDLDSLKWKRASSLHRFQSKGTDKMSLSSYIRLFEPLVIKALKLYTVSSDVVMQRSVLELLIHLVEIRVNYCLLDSEQIFIGYVIKQFEYIEEGQIKHAEKLIPSMFSFLVLLSYERHHSKSIIGVPKIIQLCDGLMASGQPPLSHCILALKPLVEDLFLERVHASAVDQKELETQREVICSMLLRLANYYQVLQLLSIVLVSTKESNKDRWRKLSRQILDVILPKIGKLQINIDSKEALQALEEVFNSLCTNEFRPPDLLLRAILTSPCEIESTEGVEKWIGGVLVLLRVLVTSIPLDLIFERLDKLGLNLDYVRPEGEVPSPSLHQSLSPKRFQCKKQEESDSTSHFVDPLNVSRKTIVPEMALARFFLEVLRVGASELKTLEFAKLQGMKETENSSEFLCHLTLHFLLLLIHLQESDLWEPIMTSFKTLGSKDDEIMNELTESFIFSARWHPALSLRWCQFLSHIDQASPSLWTSILRSSQRKLGTPCHESNELASKKEVICLSLEFLRRAGFLEFANFVLRHSQEGEWLTWFVVQHIKDIAILQSELPVRNLLQGIYSSSAASALLIQAFHARCESIDQAAFGNSIISILSGVHPAQSGPLLVFLIDRLITSPFLVVSRSAASLSAKRLHYMLANSKESHLSANDMKMLVLTMKKHSVNKRYGQVYSLMQQLMAGSSVPTIESVIPSLPVHRIALDLNWYLQLVRNRCCVGEGGGHECGELLSHLDYNDILLIMSSKYFNLSLLPQAFRLGLNMTLQVNSLSHDTSSVDTADSEGSSVNEVSEPPLLSASKAVLLQQINSVVSEIPKCLLVFNPGGGNKYSDDLIKKFSEKSFRTLIEVLSPSVIEFMNGFTILSSKPDLHTEALENLLMFGLVNLELLCWQCDQKSASVSRIVKCVSCTDIILQNTDISALLNHSKNTNIIYSSISSLYGLISILVRPSVLPSLPEQVKSNLNLSDSSHIACQKLMELILWLENKKDKGVPPVILNPFRGIVIALGRTSVLNSVVRTPPELWSLGWNPEINGTSPINLPPFPSNLLQETEVLKQFIYRIGLLGFVDKQQFEETWMHLLSVLNATPNMETPLEEIPYINLSLSLAVRGITSLLVQTLLMPQPGNPHNSSLLSVSRDKLPRYLTTKGGHRLQKVMQQLHLKLKEVQHILRSGSKSSPKYHAGQLSVDYLASAILSPSHPATTEQDEDSLYEIGAREEKLNSSGLDVNSCLHFLHYLYSTWLSPQSGLCSSVIAEVVKSMSILCDLFTASAHHKWILETLVPLHSTHPVEDHITFQYIIIATCKALATLIAAKKEVSSFHIDGVLHIVEAGLRSIQISVRTCALHGILYLLQSPPPDNIPSLINMVASYIAKHNDGRVVESESHQITVWEVWVFLVEKYSTSSDPALPSTALQMALTAAASPSTSPRILHQVLRGVERLILVQESTPGTVEVVLKLAMDLVLNSAPAVSLAALPLFLTALHCSTKSQSAPLRLSDEFSRPEDLASDPELLLQFMEKLSVLFDRIRVCLPFEAGVLAGLLGTCLLDILPASQLLNKVITEYISSHQPHPHLLAATLFQVFEAAIHEGGENLVQEWVLLSLSNFTQRTPVALAVWCLTCFFIAASSNKWLRAGFPSVQARLGKLDESDIQVFCLAGAQFRKSLATEQQRNKFDDVFHSASSPGSPFEELLNCLKHSSEMKKP